MYVKFLNMEYREGRAQKAVQLHELGERRTREPLRIENSNPDFWMSNVLNLKDTVAKKYHVRVHAKKRVGSYEPKCEKAVGKWRTAMRRSACVDGVDISWNDEWRHARGNNGIHAGVEPVFSQTQDLRQTVKGSGN